MKNKRKLEGISIVFFLGLAVFFSRQAFGWPMWGKADFFNSSQERPKPKEIIQRQARFSENLTLFKLLRMTKALDLTEEQAAKIFPQANRVEKEKMELNRQINQEIRELRFLVSTSPVDEAKIIEKIEKIKKIRESLRLKDAEFEAFLEKNLTTVQRGKYILFNLDFAQFLSQNLERIRNQPRQQLKAPIKKSPEK